MSLYLGNKKVAPIVYVENKDLPLKTLMVTNKSSSDVKKGDTVWINKSPDYGINFGYVGFPIINENTKSVSGFSTRNAITLPEIFAPESNSWELCLKFTTGSDITTRQKLNGSTDSVDYNFPTVEFSQSTFSICVGSNGSSWDIADAVAGTYQIQANATYWIKFGFSGSEYYLEYSLDGEIYIRDITVSSNLPIYQSSFFMGLGNDMWSSSEEAPFLGVIDLSETYININGSRWWTPFVKLPKEYYIVDDKDVTDSSIKGVASENIAIGTKVANVENGGTEVDGIMSTYVLNETKTDSITIYKDKSFEGVFKIKASEWLNDNHFIQTQPNFFYVRGGSRYLWAVFNFSSSGSESYTDISFSSTEWIYLKIAYNSNMISWSYSLDGQEYTSIKTVTGRNTFLDNLTTLSFNLYFGCKFGSTNYETWSGQIDFNECYFRVDGKTVWSGIKYINGGSGLVKINTTSEIIETEIEKVKYGCDIDCFLGDVDLTNKTLQKPTKSFKFELPPDIEDLGTHVLSYKFYSSAVSEALLSNLKKITGNYALSYTFDVCGQLTKVDLQNLVEVGGDYACLETFDLCSTLKEVNLQKLTTINGAGAFNNTFSYCHQLSNISFPSLEEIIGNNALYGIFYSASRLTEINFPKLSIIEGDGALSYAFLSTAITEINFPSLSSLTGTSVFSRAFQNCKNLKTVRFPSLKTMQSTSTFIAAFYGCTNLTDIYFDSLTEESFVNNTEFQNMMGYSSTDVVHTLHFPSNLETRLQSLVTYPLFGGTSGYVELAFDLPATS